MAAGKPFVLKGIVGGHGTQQPDVLVAAMERVDAVLFEQGVRENGLAGSFLGIEDQKFRILQGHDGHAVVAGEELEVVEAIVGFAATFLDEFDELFPLHVRHRVMRDEPVEGAFQATIPIWPWEGGIRVGVGDGLVGDAVEQVLINGFVLGGLNENLDDEVGGDVPEVLAVGIKMAHEQKRSQSAEWKPGGLGSGWLAEGA